MAVTFVNSYGPTSFSSTSPETASVTVTTGDVLIVVESRDFSSSPATAFGTPTGGSLTYTLQQSVTLNNNANNDMAVWTAVATSSATFTVSLADTWAGGKSGYLLGVFQYSGCVVGTSAQRAPTSPTSSISITTSVGNAGVFLAQNDFNGNSSTPTANTTAGSFNRRANVVESTQASLYAGEYLNVGIAASKTVGTTAPSSAWTLIAVELQPIVAAPKSLIVNKALRRSTVY